MTNERFTFFPATMAAETVEIGEISREVRYGYDVTGEHLYAMVARTREERMAEYERRARPIREAHAHRLQDEAAAHHAREWAPKRPETDWIVR